MKWPHKNWACAAGRLQDHLFGLNNREINHDNNGKQDATTFCVITPAAIGPQYFREAAKVIDAAAGGSLDRVKMTEIMRRHGLTPATPPSSLD